MLRITFIILSLVSCSYRFHNERRTNSLPSEYQTMYGRRQSLVYVLESAVSGLDRLPTNCKSRYLSAAADVWLGIEELVGVDSEEESALKGDDLVRYENLVTDFREKVLKNLNQVSSILQRHLNKLIESRIGLFQPWKGLKEAISEYRYATKTCCHFVSRINMQLSLQRTLRATRRCRKHIEGTEKILDQLESVNRSILDLEESNRTVQVFLDQAATLVYAFRKEILQAKRLLKRVDSTTDRATDLQ